MATTIKLKNGSGAPLAGDLVQGEPALDLTNKRLYTEDSGGTVIEIGTNPSSLTTGTFTSTGIDDNATSTALTVTDSGIAATLTTAAQPNITSVGTLTGFTSTGIDDNATSTAITIDSSERTFFNSATNRPVSVVSTDTNAFVGFQDANSASIGHVKIGSETNDMVFYANAQERMRIKGANVGIGTTSPDADLEIRKDNASGLGAVLSLTNSNVSGRTGNSVAIGLSAFAHTTIDSTSYRGAIIRGETTASGNGHSIIFETSDTSAVPAERVRIDHDGNVGIGETNPSDGKLQISASAEAGVFVRDSSGASAAPYIRVQGQRQDGNGSESFSGGLVLEHYRTDAAVSDNKALGTIYFGGNHTSGSESNIAYGASIAGKAEGTFNSASDMPMGLAFFTGSTGRDLGTANVDFGTERMRIDSSGNVGIGTDAPDSNLHIAGSAAASLRLERNDTTVSNGNAIGNIHFEHQEVGNEGICATLGVRAGDNNGSGEFVFYTGLAGTTTERLRIDSSGNVGIGTTSPSTELHVAGSQADGSVLFRLENEDTSITTNDLVGELQFYANDGSTNGTGVKANIKAVVENTPGNLIGLSFGTSDNTSATAVEAMRIDASGNLLVGDTSTPTSSAGNIVLYNGTAPTGNATNGVILYAEDVSASSELKVRDEAGNVTTLSPHNFDLIQEGPSEDMAWSYYSERDGKRINVDMLKAIRLLEQLSGEKLVHIS